jgi:hypothetical protein
MLCTRLLSIATPLRINRYSLPGIWSESAEITREFVGADLAPPWSRRCR